MSRTYAAKLRRRGVIIDKKKCPRCPSLVEQAFLPRPFAKPRQAKACSTGTNSDAWLQRQQRNDVQRRRANLTPAFGRRPAYDVEPINHVRPETCSHGRSYAPNGRIRRDEFLAHLQHVGRSGGGSTCRSSSPSYLKTSLDALPPGWLLRSECLYANLRRPTSDPAKVGYLQKLPRPEWIERASASWKDRGKRPDPPMDQAVSFAPSGTRDLPIANCPAFRPNGCSIADDLRASSSLKVLFRKVVPGPTRVGVGYLLSSP